MSIQLFVFRFGAKLFAAALALLIATGLVAGIAALFLSGGIPFEQVVIAERACSRYAFVSEREACMRAFVALDRPTVASR